MRAYDIQLIQPLSYLHPTNIYKVVVLKTHENNHYSYSSDNINLPEIATKLRKIIIVY